MPQHMNPAEFVLDLVNTDFTVDTVLAQSRLLELHSKWDSSPGSSSVDSEIERITGVSEKPDLPAEHLQSVNFFSAVLSLLHRSFIKSYRDIVAYGIRVAMYLGPWNLTAQLLSPMLTWFRAGYYDGDCLAAIGDFPRIHTTLHQRDCKRGHGTSGIFCGNNSLTKLHSSSARHSCLSWLLHTFHLSSRTGQLL